MCERYDKGLGHHKEDRVQLLSHAAQLVEAVSWSFWDEHEALLHVGVCPVDLFFKRDCGCQKVTWI